MTVSDSNARELADTRIGRLTVADVTAGDELPARVYELSRGDLVHYAGVSGDPNPIHFSDAIAERVGLRTVIAHGMLSMGIGAGYVSDWLGDPGAVVDYQVRMTQSVFVEPDSPAEVEFTGRVKSVDEASGTAVVALVAKSEGRKIFGRATATVRLA